MIVRGVQLERRDIFDPNEKSWFARLANKLHFQTQPAVIRRELLFEVGKPYDSALVAESERLLGELDRAAVAALQADGLVAVAGDRVSLPRI